MKTKSNQAIHQFIYVQNNCFDKFEQQAHPPTKATFLEGWHGQSLLLFLFCAGGLTALKSSIEADATCSPSALSLSFGCKLTDGFLAPILWLITKWYQGNFGSSWPGSGGWVKSSQLEPKWPGSLAGPTHPPFQTCLHLLVDM